MPLQPLYLESDSLRIGANQFLTQSNAVYVGNNLHVGNTLIFGAIGGGANNQWVVPAYSNNKIVVVANNNTPAWGSGAIDLRVGTSGGRAGITFSSNVNSFSDFGFIYYYDNIGGGYTVVGSENGTLLIGVQNDNAGTATNEDVVAVESPGNIYLNPGMGTENRAGVSSWSNTSGNLWVGNNSVRYLSIHEGLQAPVTLRAPITFANSANALVFSGASNTSITLRTSPNGILSFDGGAGSLLTLSNNILGQIFSVNDISGFPIIEVTANTIPSNTFIQMGQFGTRVSIGTNTTSTSSLVVTGGASNASITAANGAVSLNILPNASAGAYNGLVSAGDIVLYFSNGTAGQGNVVFGPHTGYTGGHGIKIVANTFHTQISGNTFAISNGTVNTAFFAANGNVGISNTTPTAKLSISDNSNGFIAQQIITNSNTSGGGAEAKTHYTSNGFTTFVGQSPSGFGFFVGSSGNPVNVYGGANAGTVIGANNAANVIYVVANGNVGIGTSTPAERLRVEGTASFSTGASVGANVVANTTALYVGNSTVNTVITQTTAAFGANSSATALFVAANGNIGIGNSTPTWRLHVGTSARIEGQLSAGGSQKFSVDAQNVIDGRLVITADATNGSPNANVGIGNTAPNAKLHVQGTANIAGNVALGGNLTVAGNLTVSGTRTYINTTTLDVGDNIITLNADIGAVAPSENAGIEVHRGTSANASFLWNEAADSWVFNTGGVEQLRVPHTASAVNIVQVTGAATGGAPVIAAAGTDTNIDFALTAKGTGVTHSTTPLQVETDTVITTKTLSTTSTSAGQVIAAIGAVYRTMEFTIQAVDDSGSKFQTLKILAIHNGTTVEFTEYGNMALGGSCGTYSVTFNSGAGTIDLTVTPASTNATVFKVACLLIRV